MARVKAPADFTIPEETIDLMIENGPYKGAKITANTAVSWAGYRDINRFLAEGAKARRGEDADDAALGVAMEIFAAEALRGWNLKNRAGKVPADLDGLRSLPVPLIGALIVAWVNAIGGKSRPLGGPPSSNGEDSAPPSTPPPASS